MHDFFEKSNDLYQLIDWSDFVQVIMIFIFYF